jgi:alpha-beta hydrolase superfamily lysophospholipase
VPIVYDGQIYRRVLQEALALVPDGEKRAHELANTFTLASAPPEHDTPFLVLHGGNDRLFDERQAGKLAAHFGERAELAVEPEGNHVLHNLAYRARPRVADWVSARLGGA